MLPTVQALFTLVRQLAHRMPVTEIATSKWLVQKHGLAPMAARAGAKQFKDDLARSTVAWARVMTTVPPLVHALMDAGVKVAPIKGLAYATTLYDSPAERPMTDVDLLVAPGMELTVANILERAAFSRVRGAVFHHAAAWVREGFVIDVHRSIVGPGRSRIDLDAIWSRATTSEDGSLRLDPVDSLAFHLIHLARNRLRVPLMHIVDAARLTAALPERDVARALTRAESWQLGRAARVAWELCEFVLWGGTSRRAGGWLAPAPDDLACFNESSFTRKLVFDVVTAGSARQLAARSLAFVASSLSARARRDAD